MAGGVVLCGQGWMKMAGEGSLRAFWRGNGTNVCKNIPEVPRCTTALRSARQSSTRALRAVLLPAGSVESMAIAQALTDCAAAADRSSIRNIVCVYPHSRSKICLIRIEAGGAPWQTSAVSRRVQFGYRLSSITQYTWLYATLGAAHRAENPFSRSHYGGVHEQTHFRTCYTFMSEHCQ